MNTDGKTPRANDITPVAATTDGDANAATAVSDVQTNRDFLSPIEMARTSSPDSLNTEPGVGSIGAVAKTVTASGGSGTGGPSHLEAGLVIDNKYEVVRLIGEGGMGAVYEVNHKLIGRKLALKVLRAEVAGEEEIITRFYNEARIAAGLGCDNIIEVTDMGALADGSPYIVMEYLEGETLADRIESQGTLDVEEAVRVTARVLGALAIVHQAGVVHRDLKPENVFLAARQKGREAGKPVVKLLDFGISKVWAPESKGLHLTRTGAVLGTPYYMAPEQARGQKDLDHRVDIYATGIMLYEALTGQRPFEAENYNALIVAISTEEPVHPQEHRPDLPDDLCDVVLHATAHDPGARFVSAAGFLRALKPYASETVTACLEECEGAEPSEVFKVASLPETQIASRPSLRTESLSAAPPVPQPRTWLWPVVIVAVLVFGGVGGYLALGGGEPPPAEPTPTGSTEPAELIPPPTPVVPVAAAAPDAGAAPEPASPAADAGPTEADGAAPSPTKTDAPRRDRDRNDRPRKVGKRAGISRDVPF